MMRLIDEDDPDPTYLNKMFSLEIKPGKLYSIPRFYCCETDKHDPKFEASTIIPNNQN